MPGMPIKSMCSVSPLAFPPSFKVCSSQGHGDVRIALRLLDKRDRKSLSAKEEHGEPCKKAKVLEKVVGTPSSWS